MSKTSRSFKKLDMDKLNHKIQRELFIMPLSENFRKYLTNKEDNLIKNPSFLKVISEKSMTLSI